LIAEAIALPDKSWQR